MEGERPADAEAHVRSCPNCRAVVSDLDAIHETALSMEGADAAPPERIWVSLRVQLEQEGLIRGHERNWVDALRNWIDGALSAVPRPALAGAYLVALIAFSVALAGPGYRKFSATQVTTGSLNAQLNTAERDTVSSMMSADPVVTASLQKNLAIVDNYIALCEKSVQEEPENEIARDYLYEAYRQKADLLAQMTEGGDDR
ncbi:MAG TPA: hypothetical protein VMM16_13680 [Verrucomicrobiae bacterium]|nr:hypothetical protein [Verrucomicrobiae bacterium]